MPASIGVNLRVTGHCRQGGRKYMEDFFSVAYQQTEDERDLEYAFFGIYDGHGGSEAASYAKEHLMELIVRQKNFWSDNDEDVLKAIKEGYIATHYAMWREQVKWPKTASGLPSTAGTTASIAFIRRGNIYIGHVGDSGIVLGYQDNNSSNWLAKPLTRDHKPENAAEIQRIEQCGGKVVSKSGVPRVVWNRPKIGHQGPIRRSTPIDEIPFLAVARSLGDLWSYNSQLDEFVVSPDPDCIVIPIDTNTFRCLIFGTDGLYNMLSPQMAVHIVQQAEKHNENAALSDDHNKVWTNPSRCLVEKALERWSTTKMRADNTSVITLLLDPPGPPRAQVLQNRKRKIYPDTGLEIVTRYEKELSNLSKRSCFENDKIGQDENLKEKEKCKTSIVGTLQSSDEDTKSSSQVSPDSDDKNFEIKTRESLSYDPQTSYKNDKSDENVQINEISSSSNDTDDVQPVRSSAKTKKQLQERDDRPVLRSKNLEQKCASAKQKTKNKHTPNYERVSENRVDCTRQLRNRQVESGSKNHKTTSGDVCKSGEWLSTTIVENKSSSKSMTGKSPSKNLSKTSSSKRDHLNARKKESCSNLRRSTRNLTSNTCNSITTKSKNMRNNKKEQITQNILRNRLGR